VSLSLSSDTAVSTVSDVLSRTNTGQIPSMIMNSQTNPFKQIVLENLTQSDQDNIGDLDRAVMRTPESPSLTGLSLSVSHPVDILSMLAYESNRLETFKRRGRETFAQIDVAHLAYVGFALTETGQAIRCPWCDIQLTEIEFENIRVKRPSVARSTLSDEEWTPMRVHRHANGIQMGHDHTWCTWVRREPIGLYPNVTMVRIWSTAIV
jgi:hypothetical protein